MSLKTNVVFMNCFYVSLCLDVLERKGKEREGKNSPTRGPYDCYVHVGHLASEFQIVSDLWLIIQ